MASDPPSVAATAASATTPEPYPGALPIEIDRRGAQRTLAERLQFTVQLWLMKIAVRCYVLTKRYIARGPLADRPTYHKSYPSRPHLEAHVFLPPSWKTGDPAPPLLIDIHGGGFAIGSPQIDNHDNAVFARDHGFAVVSLAYGLAPQHPFPAPVEDLAAQIRDVLDDPTLPVDHARVALIGYSAGGNLVLAAPQLHDLHTRIAAAVAYYPAVDMVVRHEVRAAGSTPHPDGRADMLAKSSHFFAWGYIPVGTQLRDPTLSPRFTPREKLPKHLYLLGAQYDLLCRDAWTMAEELAEKEGAPKAYDTRGGDEGWQCGSIRWKRVMGVEHGFNGLIVHKDKAEEELYKRKAVTCAADVAEWLNNVVWPDKTK